MPDLVINLTAPPVIRETIDQAAHGFVVGNAIRADAVANTYVKALADNEANSMAVGIVSQVVNANQFVITYQGRILSGVPAVAAGTIMYLSDSVAGTLTSTAPAIEVPILVVSQNAVSGIVINSLQRDSGGGGGLTFAVASGTNNYTATVGATSYAAGDAYFIKFTNASTGTSQINLDGLGNKGLVKEPSVPVGNGDIVAGDTLLIVYDGTWFQAYKWSSSGIQSVTGDSVDNTDPANPVINAIPLSGTTGGNPVTGDIEAQASTTRQIFQNGTGAEKAQVILINGVEAVLRAVDAAGNASFISVQGDEIIINSSNAGFEGAKYGADYSANFVARSLVDKDYVDNAVGTPVIPIVSLTRAALQALIAGSTLDTTVTYRVTDATVADIVIDVWAATNNTLHAAMIDQTNTRFGFYNIVGDAFTEVYEPAFTLLPLSAGGTNKNITAANGAIPWIDADSFEVLAPGTAGQPLLSGGAGSPTWGTASTGPTDHTSGAAVVGFSSLASNVVWYNYNPQTKLCTVSFLFNGTSDNTIVTFTAPFTSAAIDQNVACVLNTNNGVASTVIGRLRIQASTTLVEVGRDRNLAAWTASGTKIAFGTFSYFTA